MLVQCHRINICHLKQKGVWLSVISWGKNVCSIYFCFTSLRRDCSGQVILGRLALSTKLVNIFFFFSVSSHVLLSFFTHKYLISGLEVIVLGYLCNSPEFSGLAISSHQENLVVYQRKMFEAIASCIPTEIHSNSILLYSQSSVDRAIREGRSLWVWVYS